MDSTQLVAGGHQLITLRRREFQLVVVSLLCLTGEFVSRSFKASQRMPAYIIREKLQR